MSTNPKHVNLRTSWQEHDIWYVIDRVREKYPRQSWQAVGEAVAGCQIEVKPSAGREKLLETVLQKMQSH